MSYFFPSIISHVSEFKDVVPASMYWVSSGEEAIRILIRAQRFAIGSKIALPAFVCGSVARAITAEGHVPIYLDLKNNGTFVTDYSFNFLDTEKPVALILVHLYGIYHDDSKAIESYCKEKKIFLIHDLAQSFGLDEQLMDPIFPKVYSFGPGKSSTAAGGALIKWNANEQSLLHLPQANFISSLKSKLFLKSRIYGQKKSFMDQFLQKVIDKYFSHSANITQMSTFQKKAATYVMQKQNQIAMQRNERWQKIDAVIENHSFLKSAMPKRFCLNFKYVINASKQEGVFKNYLKEHQIPYYCLGDDIIEDIQVAVPNFAQNATSFIEISCEAVIPMKEIERIAALIKDFKL